MDLQHLVDRLAEAIPVIDRTTTAIFTNRKTREAYDPGVPSMPEEALRDEFRDWWLDRYAGDFAPEGACSDEQPYEGSNGSCDLIVSSLGDGWPARPEWAIELKRIQLVGNNGKGNEYGLAKVLSPYLKDRSMLHDAERLRKAWLGSRVAIIAYGFEYNEETLEEAARLHPAALDRVQNLRDVCYRTNPASLEYGILPMLEIAHAYYDYQGLVLQRADAAFSGAWRHPCGGYGRVVGWEVSRPA